MSLNFNNSVTLIELLVALSILGLLLIGISNIETFSRFQVMTSDKRVKLQHDAAFILEHMSKQVARAIGNEKINAAEDTVVDIRDITGDGEVERIKIFIDASGNGVRENLGPGPPPGPNDDHWIAYRYFDGTAPPSRRYQVQYCSLCSNKNCQNCGGGGGPQWETLSSKITSFAPIKFAIAPPVDNTLSDNYVQIQLTACWAPENPTTCGTLDNPSVTMQNRISMPVVSVN